MTAAPVVVVANPAAGRGKAGKLIDRVGARLRALGVEHEFQVSESAADLEAKSRAAAERGARIVAVLGGDGSVHFAANGLLGSDAALAVLPAGTGDDFAKAIGPRKLADALTALVAPKIRLIDAVHVATAAGERHYVNIAGAGFDSAVNETANGMRVNLGGTLTYIAAVLATLRRFEPATYRILVDDEPIDAPAMLAVVGNGVSYGGGMHILPGASVTDGLLDVCVVKALSVASFLRAFPRVFRGTHVSHPKVQILRGSVVKMEADREILVYADGERVGPLPATFQVVPQALLAVVDPETRAVRQ